MPIPVQDWPYSSPSISSFCFSQNLESWLTIQSSKDRHRSSSSPSCSRSGPWPGCLCPCSRGRSGRCRCRCRGAAAGEDSLWSWTWSRVITRCEDVTLPPLTCSWCCHYPSCLRSRFPPRCTGPRRCSRLRPRSQGDEPGCPGELHHVLKLRKLLSLMSFG